MNLDTLRGDETEHFVPVDRVTALCQLIFDACQVLVDHQDIFVRCDFFCLGCCDIFFGTADFGMFVRFRFPADLLQVFVDHLVRVEAFLGNLDIKVGDSLESFFLDETHQDRFLHFDFPVLEAALQHLFGEIHGFGCLFAERLFDLDSCFGGDDDVQPVAFRRLGRSGDDGNRVTVVQGVFDRNVLSVYLCRDALASQLGMDRESEIEHCRPFGQLDQFACRGEDIYLVLIQVHLEILH